MKTMTPSAGEHVTKQPSRTAAGSVGGLTFAGKALGSMDQTPKRSSISDSASLLLQCIPRNSHAGAHQRMRIKAVHQVCMIANRWEQPKCLIIGDWSSSVMEQSYYVTF